MTAVYAVWIVTSRSLVTFVPESEKRTVGGKKKPPIRTYFNWNAEMRLLL